MLFPHNGLMNKRNKLKGIRKNHRAAWAVFMTERAIFWDRKTDGLPFSRQCWQEKTDHSHNTQSKSDNTKNYFTKNFMKNKPICSSLLTPAASIILVNVILNRKELLALRTAIQTETKYQCFSPSFTLPETWFVHAYLQYSPIALRPPVVFSLTCWTALTVWVIA